MFGDNAHGATLKKTGADLVDRLKSGLVDGLLPLGQSEQQQLCPMLMHGDREHAVPTLLWLSIPSSYLSQRISNPQDLQDLRGNSNLTFRSHENAWTKSGQVQNALSSFWEWVSGREWEQGMWDSPDGHMRSRVQRFHIKLTYINS